MVRHHQGHPPTKPACEQQPRHQHAQPSLCAVGPGPRTTSSLAETEIRRTVVAKDAVDPAKLTWQGVDCALQACMVRATILVSFVLGGDNMYIHTRFPISARTRRQVRVHRSPRNPSSIARDVGGREGGGWGRRRLRRGGCALWSECVRERDMLVGVRYYCNGKQCNRSVTAV